MFRCAQLGTRVAKLGLELKEEQEMNCCLRANQTQLQTQLAEEERKGKENGEEQKRFTQVCSKETGTLKQISLAFTQNRSAAHNKGTFVPDRLIVQLRNPEEQVG